MYSFHRSDYYYLLYDIITLKGVFDPLSPGSDIRSELFLWKFEDNLNSQLKDECTDVHVFPLFQ